MRCRLCVPHPAPRPPSWRADMVPGGPSAVVVDPAAPFGATPVTRVASRGADPPSTRAMAALRLDPFEHVLRGSGEAHRGVVVGLHTVGRLAQGEPPIATRRRSVRGGRRVRGRGHSAVDHRRDVHRQGGVGLRPIGHARTRVRNTYLRVRQQCKAAKENALDGYMSRWGCASGAPAGVPTRGCRAPGPAEARRDWARAPWAMARYPRADRANGCTLDVPSPRHAGDEGTPPVGGVPAVCTRMGGVAWGVGRPPVCLRAGAHLRVVC